MTGRFSRWIAELRRRKVFRVGTVYGIVALTLIEASQLVLSPFGIPAWVHMAIVALATAGFPLALVLAWALEVTPEGVRRTETAGGSGDVDSPSKVRGALLESLLLVAILGAGIWLVSLTGNGGGSSRGTGADADIASIAVLPFTNRSADPENAYFADGLADELRNELAQLEGLKVAARTSSAAFRDSAMTVPQIAEALRVATVLESSLRRDADRILVTTALIDAEGFELWSDDYERPLSDVFQIQRDIAGDIARQLGGRLLADAAAGIAGRGTRSFEALDSYLKALDAMAERSGASIREALVHLRTAVAIDPGYAQAYAGLAQAYYLLPLFTEGTPVEAMVELAREAANEAIRLDSASTEAYTTLGGIAYQIELDLEHAETLLQRAIELSPSYATAYQWLAETYAIQGRYAEAMTHIETAIDLDPVSPVVRLVKAFILWYHGRVAEADAQFREVLRMDDSFAFALFWYPNVLIELGEYDRAREIAARGAALYYADDPQAARLWQRGVELLTAALDSSGDAGDALAHWRSAPDRGVAPDWAARALAYLGDVEGSVEVLRGMRSRLDPSFAWAPVAYRWLPGIWENEEYRSLIRDTGLPLLAPEAADSPD